MVRTDRGEREISNGLGFVQFGSDEHFVGYFLGASCNNFLIREWNTVAIIFEGATLEIQQI